MRLSASSGHLDCARCELVWSACPTPSNITADRSIHIIAQSRRKGAFVTRFDGYPVNRLRTATADHPPLKRALFRKQCGQFGLCTRQIALRRVAFGKVCGATFLQRQQRRCRLLNRRLQRFYPLGGSVTNTLKFRLVTQRGQLIRQPRSIACGPVGPPLRIRNRSVGNAQLGFCPRLFSGGFGERHLALARLSLGCVACTGEGRALLLDCLYLHRERRTLRLQPRQRVGGVMR